jgi:drug/metabolite transporter (DMT)-like permease
LPFLLKEQTRTGHFELGTETRSLKNPKNLLGFFIIGIFGLVPASAFLAWGTELSTASNASILYLTVPIITALLAVSILGERMTWIRWVSLALALVGVLFVSGVDWRQSEVWKSKYLIGNVLVLLACTSSSFYNVYSKELLRRFTPMEVLVYGYALATIISIPLLLWWEPASFEMIRHYRLSTWFSVFVLSLMSWGLAMVIWMYLLKRLDVSQISVSIYLLPFLGVLIAAGTLKEEITIKMMVGGLITLGGTILITLSEGSK